MSGAVLDFSSVAAPDRTVEVCVIGSGPGGATAAWELAKAGREVLVLEEGPDRTGVKLTQRDAQMYDQLYADRGGRTTSDRSISVMSGRALGGGSVINIADVVPIGDDVLRHWQTVYGLTDFSVERVSPFRDQAMQDLSANVPDEAQLNRNNRLLREGATKLGWRGEVMHHNRVGCAGIGACLLGCPVNAKKNARFVAIPGALEAGATVAVRARVKRIEQATSELKRLVCARLDEKGYHELDTFVVQARTVVVAAGAVGSAALLLRSGLGNAHTGKHLSLQPQLPVTAVFDDDVRFFRGIPQAYAITEFEQRDDPRHGWWGFRVEAVAGTPGIVGSLLPTLGEEGRSLMALYPKFSACLVLFPDDGVGSVSVRDDGRPVVDYVLGDEQKERFRVGAKAAARAWLAAGAREVLIPTAAPVRISKEADLGLIDAISFSQASAPLLSAHQQGSVRFSSSEKEGSAAPDGRVYGTKGVYVFDSSGFPSSASSHTMAPIITISRLLTKQLIG